MSPSGLEKLLAPSACTKRGIVDIKLVRRIKIQQNVEWKAYTIFWDWEGTNPPHIHPVDACASRPPSKRNPGQALHPLRYVHIRTSKFKFTIPHKTEAQKTTWLTNGWLYCLNTTVLLERRNRLLAESKGQSNNVVECSKHMMLRQEMRHNFRMKDQTNFKFGTHAAINNKYSKQSKEKVHRWVYRDSQFKNEMTPEVKICYRGCRKKCKRGDTILCSKVDRQHNHKI